MSKPDSAVLATEIPDEYRGLPILGRGASSIALDRGDGRVAMLTRDQQKAKWLVDGCGIAILVRSYPSAAHPNGRLHKMPVLVLDMPRLYPLDKGNRSLVLKAINEFKTLWIGDMLDHPIRPRAAAGIVKVIDHFSTRKGHVLAPLMAYLKTVDPMTFRFDLMPRNFMQTCDGQIVHLDTVHDPWVAHTLRGTRWGERGDPEWKPVMEALDAEIAPEEPTSTLGPR